MRKLPQAAQAIDGCNDLLHRMPSQERIRVQGVPRRKEIDLVPSFIRPHRQITVWPSLFFCFLCDSALSVQSSPNSDGGREHLPHGRRHATNHYQRDASASRLVRSLPINLPKAHFEQSKNSRCLQPATLPYCAAMIPTAGSTVLRGPAGTGAGSSSRAKQSVRLQ